MIGQQLKSYCLCFYIYAVDKQKLWINLITALRHYNIEIGSSCTGEGLLFALIVVSGADAYRTLFYLDVMMHIIRTQ